jgi:N-acetyl-anhydromuramyl-L-alanine amidase AmpD
VLHDKRGLSAHFLLDVDGTIYQTLDLQERAWHAGSANDRSIGIEIANLGAYPNQDLLLEWYQPDETGWPMLVVPEPIGDPGLRLADFVARPSRRDMVHGEVQGEMLWQYDYTDAQYEALMKLTAGLARTFPRMVLDYPRAEDGSLRLTVLSDEEIDAFQGVLGHWHVSPRKVDPGPAFDWDRVIDGARAMFGQSQ